MRGNDRPPERRGNPPASTTPPRQLKRFPPHRFAQAPPLLGHEPLTLVCAPTGYGKSDAVAMWLAQSAPPAARTLWINARPRGAGALWRELTTRLSGTSPPGIPSQPQTPVPPLDPSSMQALELALASASRLEAPTLLVIDDYHLVTSTSTDIALAELALVSPHLSVIAIARRVTLLDSPLLTAKHRLRRIGPEQLRLSDEEIAQLLDTLNAPTDHSLQQRLTALEGWPLALRAALGLGPAWGSDPTGEERKPHPPLDATRLGANLSAFAVDSLEIIGDYARQLLLAASQIDSIGIPQASDLLGCAHEEARAAAHQLVELGLLTEVRAPTARAFACHPAVRDPLREHAFATISLTERKRLYLGCAKAAAAAAPLTAFQLLIAAEEYELAERYLAHHFTTVTEGAEDCARALHSIPEAELLTHPTLTAALIYLEHPRPRVPISRLHHLLAIWQRGLQLRLPAGAATSPGPIHLQLLAQAMVLHRVLGQLRQARALIRAVESRLPPERDVALGRLRPPCAALTPDPALTPEGSYPALFQQLAATAVAVGDFPRARHTLRRLQRMSKLNNSSEYPPPPPPPEISEGLGE